jgi:hypothetical protein
MIDTCDALPRVETPLAETYARVRERNPYPRVEIGAHDTHHGWLLPALFDPAHHMLDEHLAIMAREYKTSDLDVLVRFYFGGFTYALASAMVGPFVVDQRVPAVSPDALGFASGAWGAPEALILPHSRFDSLPDDPAAGHDDTVPVADRRALRDLLRGGLIAACEPLIAALRQRARIGARALWIAAAETCAGVLVDALPMGTPELAAQEEVRALIGDPGFALRARPEIIMIAGDGGSGLAMLGSDCCCNFKLAGERYCDTCPHRSREERLAALAAWIAERAPGQASASPM